MSGATAAGAYAVEQYVPAEGAATLELLVAKLAGAAEAVSAEGQPVRLTCSILMSEDELCIHLFATASQEAVAKTAERAAVSVERIAAATVLWPVEPRRAEP